MRLFFALSLPECLQCELARFQSRARQSGLLASWPEPGGMHLTLAFLGERDEVLVPVLLTVASPIAGRHAPFSLQTAHLGGFPQDHAARVLWLGLEEQPRLRMLVDDLQRGLRSAGFALDDKPFKAHLTLARFKVPQDVGRLQEPPAASTFEVRHLVLYRSLQTPSGSRYLPMGVIPLERL